mmetsp:Transcript_30000/g.58646  ORF Transcript_30000/g.58646 Transcript_30000/m.58646 type:complete len:115 (+) Transcript_30000:351-695(+)
MHFVRSQNGFLPLAEVEPEQTIAPVEKWEQLARDFERTHQKVAVGEDNAVGPAARLETIQAKMQEEENLEQAERLDGDSTRLCCQEWIEFDCFRSERLEPRVPRASCRTCVHHC